MPGGYRSAARNSGTLWTAPERGATPHALVAVNYDDLTEWEPTDDTCDTPPLSAWLKNRHGNSSRRRTRTRTSATTA